LANIHEQYIWRFLRAQKSRPVRPQFLVPKRGPDFVPKAAERVGLYMAPPTNAMVLSADEKPSIQGLGRAQGYLKLSNGWAMIGQSHDKRHGTSLPQGASLGSVAALVAHIESFIGSYNEADRPFVWTKSVTPQNGSSRVTRFSDSGYYITAQALIRPLVRIP
jgi:hypothetical protein